jgi:stearoyl-CoA desaturase (delta-9 desaturase)
MAVVTFGEGYHNFHHEFQHDYRNGVKPWQFDPTKWTIWLLAKVGLAKDLRTVDEEKILKAQIAEHDRQLQARLNAHSAPLASSVQSLIESTRHRMDDAFLRWEEILAEYRAAAAGRRAVSRREMAELRERLHNAFQAFSASMREWRDSWSYLPASPGAC